MFGSVVSVLAIAISVARACTQCPHPGTFTGELSLFVDPSSGRCGLQDTPSGAIFASVPAQFFDPPDEAPCDEPLNVTNPNTGKQITAIVVGQFTDASGQDLQLSSEGLAALAPDANPNHAPGVVIWTFA